MKILGVLEGEEVSDVSREIELQLITNLNYSIEFTREIHKELDPNLFQIPEIRDIASWLLEFYTTNKYVPKGHLQDLITNKKANFPRFNDLHIEIIDAMEDPRQKSRDNLEYMLQTARDYLLSRKIGRAVFQAQNLLAGGHPHKAISVLTEEIRTASHDSEDTFRAAPFSEDLYNKTRDSLFDERNALFKLGGELGEFFGTFSRGEFICFLGPEKAGKTSTLIGITKAALLNRVKVAFISIGDASPHQLLKRIYACCFQKAYNRRYFHKPVKYPVRDCLYNQRLECGPKSNKYVVVANQQVLYEKYKDKHTPCWECREGIASYWYRDVIAQPFSDYKKDSAAFSKKIKQKNWENNLRTFVIGQYSKNIEDIKDMLESEKEKTGFVPDVIVIDYMDDIDFESGDGLREFRHKNAKLWGKTRGLTIAKDCLIVTATQATRGSKIKINLEQGDESEDKRKAGFVTAMYAINQTFLEKRNQCIRYARLYAREEEFIPTDNIIVLQCLSLAQPFVFSYAQPKSDEPSPQPKKDKKY
jgi:hypothetical protein